MTTEQVFERFQNLMLEHHNITNESVMDVWNKNSFCVHILEAGVRKGLQCEKKCMKDKFYCRSHLPKK